MTLLICAAILYFVPSMIASSRHRHNTGAIFATNLLLGWTFIGWAVAFIWAMTAVQIPATSAPAAIATSDVLHPREPLLTSQATIEKKTWRTALIVIAIVLVLVIVAANL